MAYHCAVNGCSNGGYKLNKWKSQLCHKCGCKHRDQNCKCEPPFRLFPFPTSRKNPDMRLRWKQLVNRIGEKNKLWSPSKDSRVCSDHFKGGSPSQKNPWPTQNLGYEEYEKKVRRVSFFQGDKRTKKKFTVLDVANEMYIAVKFHPDPPMELLKTEPFIFPWLWTMMLVFLYLCKQLTQIMDQIKVLKSENIRLKAELSMLKTEKYVNSILKDDEHASFFTGLKSLRMFERLHNLIFPLVKRRWLGINTSKYVRKFRIEPRKFGPNRKISSKAEFLLTLMKLRLGLLGKDLAVRFGITESTCSKIFLAWLKASVTIIGSLVHIPNEEKLIGSKPNKFRNLPDLHSIIDCTEIFIETPKSLHLQSASWSDYKHHNTLKVLVACAPNSSIIYVSSTYTGRISDKALTLDCGYLDEIPPYSMIMADKGFNIQEECALRHISLYVPPGRRGTSQMTQAAVNKTKTIANHRILIEQVIRRLKTFRIIQNELPISLVPLADDIVKVCGGICNLRDPIYK